MTTIAGIGSSSGSELITMLQQLVSKRAEAAGTVATTQPAQGDSSRQATFESKLEDALVSAGLDSSQLDEVMNEVRSAVSTALSESDGTTDPREIVGQAIDQTLQEYGVDTAALKEQMKPEMGSRPPGPPPGGPGGGGGFESQISDALTAAGVGSSMLEEVTSAISAAISSMAENSDNDAKDPESIKAAVHETLDSYGIDIEAFDEVMEAGRGSGPPPPPPGGGGMSGTSGTDSQYQDGSLISYLNNSDESTDSYQWLAGLFQFIDVQA